MAASDSLSRAQFPEGTEFRVSKWTSRPNPKFRFGSTSRTSAHQTIDTLTHSPIFTSLEEALNHPLSKADGDISVRVPGKKTFKKHYGLNRTAGE